jgi:hypothetical protein
MAPSEKDPSDGIQTTVVESDSLRSAAAEAIAEIYSLGDELAELGEFVKQALDAHHEIGTYEELSKKATRIRCLSGDVGRLALDLMRQAGGLEALAEVNRAAGRRSGAG